MSGTFPPPGSFRVSDLFDELVKGLISAQKTLDENALEERETFLLSQRGTQTVPPLWFHFRRVRFDLEVKAFTFGQEGSPLTCRLIDPVTAGLIESDPLFRSRVSVVIEPLTRLSGDTVGENNAG